MVAALPSLGANAGVAVWATMGFILLWFLLNSKKFNGKVILIMVAAVIVVVGAFIAVDLLGPGSESHLGRLVTDIMRGGFGQLWTMVARKLATNFRVFGRTNWVYILLAVIIYLLYMRVRPSGDFAAMLKKNPAFGQMMITILVTGILAFCTEDSGIVLPALMVISLGIAIVWLMLNNTTGIEPERRFEAQVRRLEAKAADLRSRNEGVL